MGKSFGGTQALGCLKAVLARGEGCLRAVFLGVLTCFQGILSIGNMLVFTIIFDEYDTYGAEVSDHMSRPYSFSFNCHK